MNRLLAILLGTGFLAAGSSLAQSSDSMDGTTSLGGNLYIDGFAQIGYVDGDSVIGSSVRMIWVDVDLGLMPGTGGSGNSIGYSLGIEARQFDTSDGMAFYPALTYSLGDNSLVSVGNPRSVVDSGYNRERVFAKSAAFERGFTPSGFGGNGSFVSTRNLGDVSTSYGARFDTQIGNTKLGASVHAVDSDTSSDTAYAIAFEHKFAAISSFFDLIVFGSYEDVTGSSQRNAYQIGAETGSDKLRAGLTLIGQDSIGGLADITKVYVDYYITDTFSINASALEFSAGAFSPTFWGLGAEYKFLENAYVNASYVDLGSLFDVEYYEVSIGWRF